jgi:mannonate dehydratase
LLENHRTFLEAVLPEAQDAGVRLALHPDDPPLPAIGASARVFGSIEGLEIAREHAGDSRAWGLDLCLGTMSELGGSATVERAIDTFGPTGHIVYVHFRDVQGTLPRFHECFLGEGNLDPAGVIRRLHDVGFDGFILDDHVPGVVADTPYGHRSHAHAIGYLQGLLASLA